MNSKTLLVLLFLTLLFLAFSGVASASTPTLVLSRQSAIAGQTTLTVYGYGFAPNSVVTIYLYQNGTRISQPYWSVTTNSNGDFVASISIPSYLATSEYTISATDQLGNTASATLRVSQPQQGSQYSLLFNLGYLVFFIILLFFQPQIQTFMYRSQIERAVSTLDSIEKEAVDMVKSAAIQGGASQQEVDKLIQDALETFTIEPVERDPVGVLSRLDHILNIRNIRSKGLAKRIAPNYNGAQLSNFEVSLEAAWATHFIAKVVKHFYLVARKTNNFYLFLQLSMQVPMILEIAKIYKRATKHFLLGVPIGDSIGPLVALNLLNGASMQEIEEETEYGETQLDGRKVIVVKAKGPGATVGKPGKAIAKLVEMNSGKVSLIITIDAALKLEGEKVGSVAEGVGAAIGDPGPEKYAIEEVATKYKIPLDAIIIKQSEEDAITAMKKEIADSVPSVVERVKRKILEQTSRDIVIVAGIGNTSGVP
ncbi:hypothetical protein B9Q12_01425 [Candidatus Marsarchaeota G2 archaeon ECH_B_SAG-G06]|uniref:DUF1512 domain-containing protein n=1 Tax=Candidatus Marsarchaeota G2 archaeon ECH_B_SAG-G06 TaxID=1978166 RepID=A0A2R6C226_9ARCH|nr:MAG: hypothetical protein B9Q12_01425 [Candidatus Marsarchaeota G2 archaeon ECH_B_SAG-G06]